ncbi:hypothetical protein Tco_0585831 [Tanacetum coccineum]
MLSVAKPSYTFSFAGLLKERFQEAKGIIGLETIRRVHVYVVYVLELETVTFGEVVANCSRYELGRAVIV